MTEYPKVERLQVYTGKIKADIKLAPKYNSQVVFTENNADHLDPTKSVDIGEVRKQAKELIGQNEILES